MITLTKHGRNLYVGIDVRVPYPEIPKIMEGQLINLYEYTYTGPKYVGTFMADYTNFPKLKIGPLTFSEIFDDWIELQYKGYYQFMVYEEPEECFDCTPVETFYAGLRALLFTDNYKFFEKIFDEYFDGDNSILRRYKYITYVDGILTLGNHIREINGIRILPIIENNTLYFVDIDGTQFPPCEVGKTKILELPFRIKNGTITHMKIHNSTLYIEVNYSNFLLDVYYDLGNREIDTVCIHHENKKQCVDRTETTQEVLIYLINVIDEKQNTAIFDVFEMLGVFEGGVNDEYW